MISIFLLTGIGMLNNTLSYNYIKVATNTSGEGDIMITRTLQTDFTYDPFFDEDIIQEKLKSVPGVEEFLPRVMMFVKASSENSITNGTYSMYGLDFEGELNNGKMGDLVIIDEQGEKTKQTYKGTLNDGECVLLENMANNLNISKGDYVKIQYQQYSLRLKVIEICIQDQKFSELETSLILVNLKQAQSFFNRKGEINFIYGTIKNRELIYDVSNLDLTTQRLRTIGTAVQKRLDINEYSVSMPKLEELEGGEFYLMGVTMIFWFIIILSMVISGILINSILSTSAEERGFTPQTDENKNLELVLDKPADFKPGARYSYSNQPTTIIIALIIGITIPVVVSILPGIKTAKIQLIKSITPFRTKEEGWEIQKEGSMNLKSFLIGISISLIGLIIFILMPMIFVSGDFMLIAGLFIGLLSAILLGLVFASIGVIPYIQRFFLFLISPLVKKYKSIIHSSLTRNRRRNTSTIVMFAISFSFIFFVTSIMKMETRNMSVNLQFQYGSDLVLVNQGTTDPQDSVTMEMINEIKQYEGIEKLAISLHNTIDIQAAISAAFDFSEGGGYDEDSTQNLLRTLFNFYAYEERTKYIVHASDVAKYEDLEVGFIGVNQDFVDLIDKDLLIWESPRSGMHSFTQILNSNNSCILSKSVASRLGISEVGEKIRLTFYDPQVENDPGNITLFTVVGISGGIPGFWNFRSSEAAADGGGVLVSLDTYIKMMDVKNSNNDKMIVDKVFINLKDNSEESIKLTKEAIQNNFKEKNFVIDDAISKINYIENMNERQSAVLETILMFTVMISIFGLISSMYAVFLERKFEIGIIRSMGLKPRNVRHMFLAESLIILLSSGIMGTIIGVFSAYLLESNMALMTEMPITFEIPLETLMRVFIISILVGTIGMYLILYRLSKKNIMDIFRQTF
ncbi:MAG: FtsX-like permease family protein [Candidatus Lokiarchaeota archaeon]